VYGPEELLGIASAAGGEFDVAADDERRGSIEAQIGSESHASDRAALGGDAAAGGSPDFPRRAKAAFTYAGGSNSEVSEELYSDTEATLSQGTGRIFDAMTSCPSYQVVVGSTPIDIATQQMSAPQLGDEQWSLLMTFTAGGSSTVVKQTAIRTGTTVVLVTGSPGLVDAHVDKALAKARSAN
jgi:hypothetical protein